MIDLADLKTRLLNDPEIRAEHEALEAEYALARELIAARTCVDLSQEQVAERMGTSQSTDHRAVGERTHPAEPAHPGALCPCNRVARCGAAGNGTLKPIERLPVSWPPNYTRNA